MKLIVKHAGLIGLAVILFAFILAKAGTLSLPYFWDELGVYAPGSLNMKDTGHFGLAPNCMDPELSRGHPLLSYLGYAVAYQLFGDTTTVGHGFTLLLAILTLLSCYVFIAPAFGKKVALGVCALLAIQPLFFAMAGIVMPEMMLTLFSVLAVGGVVTQRWWLYLVSGICCVLIKEAGIVIPVTAALYLGIGTLHQRKLFTIKAWLHFLIALTPLFAFLLFLLIQKQQHGWYFFPLHTHLMRRDAGAIWRSVVRIVNFIFLSQGRWFLFLFLCAGLAIYFIRNNRNEAQRKWLLASVLFIFVALGFAAPNYHLVRYILYVLPFSILLAVAGIEKLAALVHNKRLASVIFLGGCLGGLITALFYVSPRRFADNADMSYRFFVETERDCIHWAERQPWRDSTVTINFPVIQALADHRNGYLTASKPWKMVIQSIGRQNTKYGIYYWQGGVRPSFNSGLFQELKRFNRYDATFSVIARQEP